MTYSFPSSMPFFYAHLLSKDSITCVGLSYEVLCNERTRIILFNLEEGDAFLLLQ